MSASTASITANRWSAMLAGENERSNLKPVNDGIASPHVDNKVLSGGAGAVGKKVADGSNEDPSHSIGGGRVSKRSKDLSQMKKPSRPSSTVSPLRTRKLASPKSVKPWWQTVLSVTVKNLLLLFFLAGTVRKLMEFSDMQGRIADVESYLKKMKGETLSLRSEMGNRFDKNSEEIERRNFEFSDTQCRIADVESYLKEMKGEILSLRSEMDNRFDKSSEEIASRLNILDEKHQLLEKALGLLNSKDLLSKEDFTRLYEEFIKSKIDLSFDEIRALARQIVEQENEKHAADGLGRVDYALGTGGAMVLMHSAPCVVVNWRSKAVQSDPQMMLKPSFGEPGQCFPLEGSSGFVQIKLRAAIIPEAVTLEHVAMSVVNDRSSAPRDCRVFGWLQEDYSYNTKSSVDGEHTLLTEFTYDLDKSNAQTYNVIDSASSAVVDTIRFDFTSNHGSPSYTCIYRLRVHGHEPNLTSPVHCMNEICL